MSARKRVFSRTMRTREKNPSSRGRLRRTAGRSAVFGTLARTVMISCRIGRENEQPGSLEQQPRTNQGRFSRHFARRRGGNRAVPARKKLLARGQMRLPLSFRGARAACEPGIQSCRSDSVLDSGPDAKASARNDRDQLLISGSMIFAISSMLIAPAYCAPLMKKVGVDCTLKSLIAR